MGFGKTGKPGGAEAREKVLKTIDQMAVTGQRINFNSVSKVSGISKSFLYDTEEIRERIEKQRKCEVNNEMNRCAKYDKTSRSKDVIIEAKDKRIARLEHPRIVQLIQKPEDFFQPASREFHIPHTCCI